MRYAILSDIQGNRPAWGAVMVDMDRLKVEMPVCLGDVIGYGPHGLEVLQSLRTRTGNIVLGDHDAAAAGLSDATLYEPGTCQAIEWNRARMDPESLQYLASRPLSIESGPLIFAHAEVLEPGCFGRIDDVEIARKNLEASDHRVVFVGHAHDPALFCMDEEGKVEELPAKDCKLQDGRRYLVRVGSVGEPSSANDVRARYVVYDHETEELTFRALSFDVDAYRTELIAARLSIRPWFLKVDEDQSASAEPPVATPPIAVPAAGPSPLVATAPAPAILAPPAAAPHYEPAPVRRRSGGAVAWLAFASVLILVGAIAIFVVMKVQQDSQEEAVVENTNAANSATPASATEPSPSSVPADPPRGEKENAKDEAGNEEEVGVAPEGTQPDPEEAVAVVPVPEPAPSSPAPEPEPTPDPEPDPAPKPGPVVQGPAPIPPAPENLAALTPITTGLMFYAPLDEDETEFTARDLAAGRELDATSAQPGAIGRVGLACRLEKENGSDAMLSKTMPLPEIKALTIAFWMRRPEASADADPDLPEVLPAAILVAIKGYCEVRFENDEILANLDLQGEPSRIAFPPGRGWHHVLVEHGDGNTTIWIDHRSQSEAVAETLAAVPAEGKPIQIGSKGASFYIDEVALWNRKFSKDERQFLYRQGRLDTPILSPPKTVAYWGFDVNLGTRLFADAVGSNDLGSRRSWKPTKGIAPNPVPLSRKINSSAALVSQVTEREESVGSFVMKIDAPLTYEGWVKLGRTSVGTLGGTLEAANESKLSGWRLAVNTGQSGKGFLAFIYDTGTEKLQAVSEEVPLYDGLPHHFAAIWNPRATDTHGSMEVFLDNQKVASATVPLTALGPPSEQPFHIAMSGMPIVVDELRFSSGALKPADFLTGGKDRVPDQPVVASTPEGKPAPEGETPMQRRDRMAKARRAEQKAEREARKKAEEAKRKR